MDLAGKRAFITGGSGGLGSAISGALAAAGVHIAVGYHQGKERAERVAALAEKQGVRAAPVQIDISDPVGIEHGVAETAKLLGGLDVLVNNAATTRRPEGDDGSLEAITPDYWDAMMASNTRGPFLVTRVAEGLLRASGAGRIVNIGSTIGQGAHGADLPFSVTKAAIAPLTRFLAVRLSPDVLVNCVAPGLMLGTGLTKNASEGFADTWRAAALTGHTTAIDDVARQVVTLCATDTMTGQVIVVDGGIHLVT